MHAQHERLVNEVPALPTAPFAEHAVAAYIRNFCEHRGDLAVTEDAAGNLLVRYRRGRVRRGPAVCLTAHLDHPGFVAERMVSPTVVRAVWRGGVRPEYFDDAKVRFWENGSWVRGQVRRVRTQGRGKDKRVLTADLALARSVSAGAVGMWDLPEPRVDERYLRARACDDLAGVAGILCCLERLCRTRAAGEGYALFTRAEEVGFVGALAAARLRTIPDQCVVVAVETSSALPNARIGDGPILRVGDRSSVFSPGVTAFCRRVADRLAKRDRGFAYQRKLMDGGSCESTAYAARGYRTTGVCLALGNYHNMNTKRGRIASEYVGRRDFEQLVKWFVALILAGPEYREQDVELEQWLRRLEKEHAALLRATR